MSYKFSRAASAVLAAALAVGVSRAALAAEPLHVGTMSVIHHGDHGTPIVLIPGLTTGGWVWDDLVARLEKDHELYVVTLAGFDGVAPVKGKLMELANASLLELIKTQRLDHPVLIGHSLGGTLSVEFAIAHSDLIAGVIAVDGLPVLPGTEGLAAGARAGVAENFRKQMAAMTPEQFAAQQQMYMSRVGVIDPALAKTLAERTSRSDPAATGQYASEDVALDLRPQLGSIKVPVLEVMPFNEGDKAPSPATGKPMSQDDKAAYYASLLKGTPNVQIAPVAPARHFVMLDQPEQFATTITTFLATLPAKTATTNPAATK